MKSGGEFFDFAHLHGDEFAAQHNSEEAVRFFVSRLMGEVARYPVEAFDDEVGDYVPVPVAFRFGLGEWTYKAADQDLNERKAAEPKPVDPTSFDFGDNAENDAGAGPEGTGSTTSLRSGGCSRG
jgi:hypothetical protein